MVHLSCPICPHGFLADVRDLQQRISSVLTRSLHCPICSETLVGLPALDAHLAQHLPYRQCFTNNCIQTASLIGNLAPPNLTQDNLLGKERDPGNSSPDGRQFGSLSAMRIMGIEAIPSLEKLEITDDKLSAELTQSLSAVDGNSGSPASPRLVNMQNLSRTSSRCSVTGEELRPSRDWSAPPSVEQHSCDTCGLVFSSEHFLRLHMDVIHKHSDCFEVCCKICKAKFDDLESYRNHVRESHSERRYLCEECPKTFKLRGSLVVHKRMYHDGSPSVCQICNKKFPSHTRREFHERRYHATGSKSIFKGKSVLHGSTSSLHDMSRHDTEPQSCSQSIQDARQSLENLMEETRPGKEGSKVEIISNVLQDSTTPSTCPSATENCNLHSISGTTPKTSDSFVSRQDQLRDSIYVEGREPEAHLKTALVNSNGFPTSSDIQRTNSISLVNNKYHTVNRVGETQQFNPKQKVSHLQQPSQSSLQNLVPQFSVSVPSNIGGIVNEEIGLNNFILARQMSCSNNSKYFEILQQMNRTSSNNSSSNSIGGIQVQDFPYSQTSVGTNIMASAPPSAANETEAKFKRNIIEKTNLGHVSVQQTSEGHVHLQPDFQRFCDEEVGGVRGGAVLVDDNCGSFAKPNTPEDNTSRGSREAKAETSPGGPGDSKQWLCDVCKKTFTTKYFLKKHKRLHTGETPYCCGECGKTFTFQQSYHKHVLYHSDDKPHSCSYCGRSFKEMSTLHNHVRIHTGEKPFACDTCGKAFRQRVSYLVHLRIHTGALPYTCTECGKSFRYKVSLRSHKCENAAKTSSGNTPEQVPSPANRSSTPTTEQGAGPGVQDLQVQHDGSASGPITVASRKVQDQGGADVTTSNSYRAAPEAASEHLTEEIQDMDIDTAESDMDKGSDSSAQSVYSVQGLTSTNFIKPPHHPATNSLTSTRNFGTSFTSSSSNDLSTPPLNDATDANHHHSSGWSIPYMPGKVTPTILKSSSLSEDPLPDSMKQFSTIASASHVLGKWEIAPMQGNYQDSKSALNNNNQQRNVPGSKDTIGRQDTQIMEAVFPYQMETCPGIPMSFQNSSLALCSKQQMLQRQQQQKQHQQQHPSSVTYVHQPQQLQEQQYPQEYQHHRDPKDPHHNQHEEHLQSHQLQPQSSAPTILSLSQDSDEETDLDPESFFKSLFS